VQSSTHPTGKGPTAVPTWSYTIKVDRRTTTYRGIQPFRQDTGLIGKSLYLAVADCPGHRENWLLHDAASYSELVRFYKEQEHFRPQIQMFGVHDSDGMATLCRLWQ
jgi:hypothetical protein